MCPDCKDTGVIHLLTSTVPCACRLDAALAPTIEMMKDRGVRIDTSKLDEACFGTINGVTLHGDPALHRDRAPTYTLEVEDSLGRRSQFTGLEKHQVDTVHAMLKAGWTAEGIRDHLNELWTAARVRQSDKDRQAADLKAAGFTVDELKALATKIEERLFTVSDDGEAEQIIFDEIAGLICRNVIHGAMKSLIPNVMSWPKGFAKGGIVSGERFQQQCGFSFVKESCFGVNPTGQEIRSDRQLHKAIRLGQPTGCGKAEFFKRMYGGKPDLSIDTSQIELRMLAHLQEPRNERPDPEFPGSPPPSPD